MRRVLVVVCAGVATVVVTAGLAVALTVDDDDVGPGMMSTTAQERGPGGVGRRPMMQGPGRGGMAYGRMSGGMSNGMFGDMHVVVRSEYTFLVRMIAHHQEAIAAAGELSRSDRPEMHALGRSIVEGQTAQVEQMQGWLDEWYPNRPTTTAYRPMMRDLTGLSGDELDQAFLEDMIWHHMSAVMMSQHLVARGLAEHGAVEDLARSISASQRSEIVSMRRWLWQWFG